MPAFLLISPQTQFSSSPFLLLVNLGVDKVLGVDELPSTSAKILPLASFVTSLKLLSSTSKCVTGEFMFVDIELEELSKSNFNVSTKAQPEDKLVRVS